jgi:hypothetical protein
MRNRCARKKNDAPEGKRTKQFGRFTLCNSELALSEAEGSPVLKILNCRNDARNTKAAPKGGFVSDPKTCYGITPAGACGLGPAVVAAAASFKILWWMVKSASSRRSDTPILS